MPAARCLRSTARDCDDDLDRAIAAVEEALARDDVGQDQALLRRAHLLRGPALHLRAQRQHRPDNLHAAVSLLQIVVNLTDTTDPNLPLHRRRLAEVQQLHTDGSRTPP